MATANYCFVINMSRYILANLMTLRAAEITTYARVPLRWCQNGMGEGLQYLRRSVAAAKVT